MTKGGDTRSSIVREALSLATSVGLEGVSLGVLASRLDLSKSGLFAHFKSKEALQIAVIDEARERFAERVVLPALAKPRGEPRVQALFENQLKWSENNGLGSGCIFMALVQEYDDRPGPLRDRVVDSQREWRDIIAKAVTLAAREGHFRKDTDAEQFAFEFVGLATSFQESHKLFRDKSAKMRAHTGFERLLASVRARRN